MKNITSATSQVSTVTISELVRENAPNVKLDAVRESRLDSYRAVPSPFNGGRLMVIDMERDVLDETVMQDLVLANVILERNKTNSDIRDAYMTIFNDTDSSCAIQRALRQSFVERNWNKMEAAIDVLAERGDLDLIADEVLDATENGIGELNGEGFKRLSGALIKFKCDSVTLAGYAKSIRIRRSVLDRYEIAFEDYLSAHPDATREQAVEAVFEDKALRYKKSVDEIKTRYNALKPFSVAEWIDGDGPFDRKVFKVTTSSGFSPDSPVSATQSVWL